MVDTAADCTTKEIWAFDLADLYPAGTRLADVPTNFRGMPWNQYAALAAAAERTAAFYWFAQFGAPLAGQREWRPADSYGARSL